ncbi:Tail-anchored protein insertion receptor WRB [Liparis tanakae]|uniref:Guided entry of tail-anchored proteins factor 1 n=1 Tax=Liparis tanakae TaxID=230148 RepID=A0A4Z2HVZ4_9TELE|nr:Tail-anchored protein insertion receptor WRB [Liparis tanakae]
MAAGYAWFLVLGSVFLCNLMKTLLPTISSLLSKMVQKDAEQESEMRVEVQEMKKEHASINMMDEFARYARLERKINKMTDKLKSHVKSRTAQQAKMKWVVNIVFYILQAAVMISLIWKYYADPVTVVPSKWIAPVERLVAFPTGVAGQHLWPLVMLGYLESTPHRSNSDHHYPTLLLLHTSILLSLCSSSAEALHSLEVRSSLSSRL